ncbi:catenin alpha-2-like protein [Cricetulus griseus]|nr:catenin alpha-2-like protein [Cricetulus griseus]
MASKDSSKGLQRDLVGQRETMRIASSEFADDPCSSVKRGTMVRAARALLSAVTRLLILADMADVMRLLSHLKIVEEALESVKNATNEQDLANRFKEFGKEMVKLNYVAARRQQELKDPHCRDEMAAARGALKKNATMLYTASQAFLRHPDVAATRANRDYVFKQVQEAIAGISSAAQATSPTDEAKGHTGIGELAAALNEFDNKIILDPMTFSEARFRPSLEERLESIISGAALMADSSCTRDDRRERIVAECNAVRQALQDLLSEYMNNGCSQDLEFYLLLLLSEQHGAKDMSAEFSFILQNTRIPINEQLLPKRYGVREMTQWLKFLVVQTLGPEFYPRYPLQTRPCAFIAHRNYKRALDTLELLCELQSFSMGLCLVLQIYKHIWMAFRGQNMALYCSSLLLPFLCPNSHYPVCSRGLEFIITALLSEILLMEKDRGRYPDLCHQLYEYLGYIRGSKTEMAPKMPRQSTDREKHCGRIKWHNISEKPTGMEACGEDSPLHVNLQMSLPASPQAQLGRLSGHGLDWNLKHELGFPTLKLPQFCLLINIPTTVPPPIPPPDPPPYLLPKDPPSTPPKCADEIYLCYVYPEVNERKLKLGTGEMARQEVHLLLS